MCYNISTLLTRNLHDVFAESSGRSKQQSREAGKGNHGKKAA